MEVPRETQRKHHSKNDPVNDELVPGTEIMSDMSNGLFLIPKPENDEHDPLNWSLAWKISAISVTSYVSFVQGLGPLALAPMFSYYVEDFGCTLSEAVQFSGVCILVLAFSNFIWVPISNSWGRRPVLIFSTLICLGSSLWRAEANSYWSFMGACIMDGIGAGPADTIQPSWTTLYWVVYMGSFVAGPLISGAMAKHIGWRSAWWLYTGMLGLALLLIVFLLPETLSHRGSQQKRSCRNIQVNATASGEDLRRLTELFDEKNDDGTDAMPSTSASGNPEQWLGRGKPSRKQWMLYQSNPDPWKAVALDLWVPWKLFAFPIVEFASFVVSFSCSSFLIVNLSQEQAFGSPPYSMAADAAGLLNISILVGALIGLFSAGPLSDWTAARLTAKNGGVGEPEIRLPAMIPYVLIMILGHVVLALGYDQQWHWAAIVVIGFTCAGIQMAALPSIVSTYAIDSYKSAAGSLFVSITVNKNVWGYGFSKFTTPWSEKSGYTPPVMTNMA
ncbi:major facilitator superfamily domain-containing protein [Phyllosticta citriasiana]|uniref:Major facilitator superfamily domain-containing protein n=1 Tax=Phyllosticta citriasiana TaxID=595635 RepID=A0ABR1KPW7_9PEZI